MSATARERQFTGKALKMRHISVFHCLAVVALGFLLAPAAVWASETLAQAINTADAKYLKVAALAPADTAPKIESGGEEDEEGTPATRDIAQGPIKATLSYIEGKDEQGEATRIPVVTVFADGKEVAKLKGEDSGLGVPPVSVQIAEIDPANAAPEIVVSFYTGGAHCCSDTKILTQAKDGPSWRTVELGELDGGPLIGTDLDGDGRYEFESRDNAFLYTFGCYACSIAPLEILAVDGGEVKNATKDPRFRPAHEAYLKDIITNVPDEDVNGFPGYVAEKILLGEGKQGWALMLAHYDRESDWGLEVCDQKLNEQGDCPGQTLHLSFPDALERMLNENGYKVEK